MFEGQAEREPSSASHIGESRSASVIRQDRLVNGWRLRQTSRTDPSPRRYSQRRVEKTRHVASGGSNWKDSTQGVETFSGVALSRLVYYR